MHKKKWDCQVQGHCPTARIRVPLWSSSSHPQPAPGEQLSLEIRRQCKDKGADDFFKSAATIVTRVLGNELGDGSCSALPNEDSLARQVNRCRQKQRPKDPTSLEFVVDEANIPENFLKHDVWVDGRRHLVFATQEMLSLLSRAKTWYIDATFKVVGPPFTQLFSVHAFVKGDEDIKQVPLAFVLMSGKRTVDYVAVMKGIVEVLPTIPEVKGTVLDFEAAMWNAIREVLPGVAIRGCLFHFTQAVWRKVQEFGLATVYHADDDTRLYVRKLMALPLVPKEHIRPLFETLKVMPHQQL